MTNTFKLKMPSGKVVDATIKDDPKRAGFLIGSYKGNIQRVLYGKKWQTALRNAFETAQQ